MRKRTKLKGELRKGLGQRLVKLRNTLNISRVGMAKKLDRSRTTYFRNEDGVCFPEFSVLFELSEKFDVSIDWLLCNRGPMFYKQKESEQIPPPDPMENHDCMDSLKDEYRELITYMEKLPVLRYEILLNFRKYLEENSPRQILPPLQTWNRIATQHNRESPGRTAATGPGLAFNKKILLCNGLGVLCNSQILLCNKLRVACNNSRVVCNDLRVGCNGPRVACNN